MKNFNKLTAISIAVSSALSYAAQADIYISQYVEGAKGYNKAIEIYNPSAQEVDLSQYSLVYHKNGAKAESVITDFKNMKLAPKKVLVLAANTTDVPVKGAVKISAYFNGNDAVVLKKGDIAIDMIGTITKDDFAKDVSLERKEKINAPSATFVKDQWVETKITTEKYIRGLGSRQVGEAPAPVELLKCDSLTFTPINEIQGDGFKSPKIEEGKYESAEEFVIKGIVTARSNRNDGFFMQAAAADFDSNDKTSEGIFVYLGKSKDAPKWLEPGSQVCVQGKVKEQFGLTQMSSAEAKLGKTSEVKAEIPAAIEFKLVGDETYTQAMERHEGMKIKLVADSEMVVTSPYGYNGRYNSMALSHKAPLFKPTQIHMAETKEAADLQKANDARRLEIETDLSAPKGHIPYFPDFNAETGYMRVGDTLQNMEGAVGYSYGKYRLYVTNEIKPSDFTRKIERADIETPALAEKGDLRIASFNVLNYFISNSEIGGALNASCKDQQDADAHRGCNRGAKTKAEFELQREKIVKALKAMNADIVGLMEIENNGFADDSAIHDLVTELNKEMSNDDLYKFVKIAADDMNKDKFFGTDAIMVGMLYRPAKAKLEGDALVIKTPEQHAPAGIATRTKDGKTEKSPAYNKYQRHSLGQTFVIGENKLTIVVNHFKSKGSGCLEDWVDFADKSDPKDLQGRCNDFRVSAAEAIGNALKPVKGDVLIIGDLNAYGKEDPLQVLTDYHPSTHNGKIIHTAAHTTLDGKALDTHQRIITEGFGYINLNTKLHGADTYSYKWAGELGNLDHALANKSLAGKVMEIEDWHINSAESTLFEYSSKYTGDLKKANNVFSSSDHDPVIIAIDYKKDKQPAAKPTPAPEKKKSSGSLGFLALGLLSLAGIRRRFYQ